VGEPNYWKTWVTSSMEGIVSTTMGKHGIGRPYVEMRNIMMMGTIVTVVNGMITLTCKDPPPLPLITAPAEAGPGSCASALTKMTSVMYQENIDAAKHGKPSTRVTGIRSLLTDDEQCYC
jgi:hypothetical protein